MSTANNLKSNPDRAWYVYIGNNAPLYALSSYTIINGEPACSDGTTLCAIYATGTALNPINISNNVKQYLSNSLAKFTAQPDAPINTKYFVLMKNT